MSVATAAAAAAAPSSPDWTGRKDEGSDDDVIADVVVEGAVAATVGAGLLVGSWKKLDYKNLAAQQFLS